MRQAGRIYRGELTKMATNKKKLSPSQRAARKEKHKEYMTVFMNGKQKRVKRPPTIDGIDADEFIARNTDPIWLHENEMWDLIDQAEDDDHEEGDR